MTDTVWRWSAPKKTRNSKKKPVFTVPRTWVKADDKAVTEDVVGKDAAQAFADFVETFRKIQGK